MKYLILADHRCIPIEHITERGQNQFTILVPVCAPLNECIVYDDENGNNRVSHVALIHQVRVAPAGKIYIDLTLSPATVAIDFHPVFDAENRKPNQT